MADLLSTGFLTSLSKFVMNLPCQISDTLMGIIPHNEQSISGNFPNLFMTFVHWVSS